MTSRSTVADHRIHQLGYRSVEGGIPIGRRGRVFHRLHRRRLQPVQDALDAPLRTVELIQSGGNRCRSRDLELDLPARYEPEVLFDVVILRVSRGIRMVRSLAWIGRTT